MENQTAAYKALLLMNSKLLKANQQLVEALIAKNATEYALAQHFIQRATPAGKPSAPVEDQTAEEALGSMVDNEAGIAASDVD